MLEYFRNHSRKYSNDLLTIARRSLSIIISYINVSELRVRKTLTIYTWLICRLYAHIEILLRAYISQHTVLYTRLQL